MNGLLLFHLNLDFSSIDLKEHRHVINTCYYPILKIAKKHNVKISLEFSGKTLERIFSLDKNFIRELKRLIDKNSIEIVGCGYVQSIGPLLPHQINNLNLQEGQNIYSNILGIRPKTALISEMTLSHSLIDLYLDAGFETIIMDIDNIAESLNVSKDNLYR